MELPVVDNKQTTLFQKCSQMIAGSNVENVAIPVDNFGTVVGENPDCLLLSGTVVGENPDHVCWDSFIDSDNIQWCTWIKLERMANCPMPHILSHLTKHSR